MVYFYLNIHKVDRNGKADWKNPYKGQIKFKSLDKARAKLINLINTKPKGLEFEYKVYANSKSFDTIDFLFDSHTKFIGEIKGKSGKWYWYGQAERNGLFYLGEAELYKNGSIKRRS